jgi:hypothetical protein
LKINERKKKSFLKVMNGSFGEGFVKEGIL